jgi:hypothetical protein
MNGSDAWYSGSPILLWTKGYTVVMCDCVSRMGIVLAANKYRRQGDKILRVTPQLLTLHAVRKYQIGSKRLRTATTAVWQDMYLA